jgi:WD40 repeat protein
VLLVDALELRPLSSFRALVAGPVRGLAYVPRSGLLAVSGDNGALVIADPRSGRRVATLPGHHGTVAAPSISADGRLMASVVPGNSVLLQPLRGGRPAGPARGYDRGTGIAGPADAALSPDGRTLAVTSVLGVDLIDVATLRRRGSLQDTGTVRAFARFTPDGRSIIAGSTEGWARLWSVRTLRPVTPKLGLRAGDVQWASTSPDGRTLATGSIDGVVRLFDLATGRAIGTPLPGVPNRPAAPLFTPDGAHLFVVTNAGRAYRWDVRPAAWAGWACAVAGRSLSRGEWAEALGERPYRPACRG